MMQSQPVDTTPAPRTDSLITHETAESDLHTGKGEQSHAAGRQKCLFRTALNRTALEKMTQTPVIAEHICGSRGRDTRSHTEQ